MKINYNSFRKPMQPDNIDLNGLYDKASYSGIVFDYVLHLLQKKFKDQKGLDCEVKVGPVKGGERAVEKLVTDLDLKKNPSNILDILRATITVSDVETLLDFIDFTTKVTFQYKDFKKSALNKTVLSGIKDRLRSNVVEIKKNMEIVDICMDAAKKSEGKDEDYKEEIERKRKHDVSVISNTFRLPEESIDFETDAIFDYFNIFLHEEKNLPSANVGISNGFSLAVSDQVKQKYPFLKAEPKIKESNYMDFKFYVCIPTPLLENEYMICEVIATLDCFDKVYPKTHILYEASRKDFKEKVWDDMKKEELKILSDTLRQEKYIELIKNYNNKHPSSIQILPYKDDKKLREQILNQVCGTLTFTSTIWGCRDLIENTKGIVR